MIVFAQICPPFYIALGIVDMSEIDFGSESPTPVVVVVVWALPDVDRRGVLGFINKLFTIAPLIVLTATPTTSEVDNNFRSERPHETYPNFR